jgi:hypothetical protein
MPKNITLSREELFDLVWSIPLREVAKDLGLSDVGLAKRCRKNGIPLPPQGYWLRSSSRANNPRKPVLQALIKGQSPQFQFRPLTEEAASATDSARAATTERLAKANIDGSVSSEILKNLLQNIKRAINRKSLDERKIMRGSGDPPWAIRTSPAQADRALQVLRSVYARIHALGYTLSAVERHDSMISFSIDEAEYWLWTEEHASKHERELNQKELREKAERAARGWNYYVQDRWVYTPNGKLVMKLAKNGFEYPLRQWSDTARQNLEDRLDEIVIDTVALAAKSRADEQQAARERAAKEAIMLTERQKLQKTAHEALKRRSLFREARHWSHAREISQYIDAIEAMALSSLPQFPDDDARESWLSWARQAVAETDPISNESAAKVPPLPELPDLPWNWSPIQTQT